MNWLLTICFISEVGLSTPSHVEAHESSRSKTAFMQKVLIGGLVCSFLQNCYKSNAFNDQLNSLDKKLDYKIKINRLDDAKNKSKEFIGEDTELDLLEKNVAESFWKNDCLTSDDVKGWRCGHSDCLDFSEEIKCSEYNKFLDESNQNFKCSCEESRVNKKEKNKINHEIDLTIIMVHNGSQDYVQNAVKQLIKHSKNLKIDIVRIGNKYEPHDFHVTYVNSETLVNDDIEKFRSNYVHKSPNSVEYERFCLERWLLISSYLEKMDVQTPVVAVDSDFLLLDDLSTLISKTVGKDFASTINYKSGQIRSVLPHFTYFKDKSISKKLNDYIIELYEQDPSVVEAKLKSIGTRFEGRQLVSDMYILGGFLAENFKNDDNKIYTYRNILENQKIIVTNFLNSISGLSIKNSNMLAKSFSLWNGQIENIELHGIHFQGHSKRYENLLLKSLDDSMNHNEIICDHTLSLKSQEKELYCTTNEKTNATSFQFYGSTDQRYVKIDTAINVPKVYKDQLDSNRFQFVTLPGTTDRSGFIASGNYGTVYLVFDRSAHELLAAKFIKHGLDEERKKTADHVNSYEHELAKIWNNVTGNPLEIEKIDKVILKTFIKGESLYHMLMDGKLSRESKEINDARKSLEQLVHKMFDQKLVISDLNVENLIYSDDYWVIIDGDNVIPHDDYEDLFEEFRNTIYFSKKFKHHNSTQVSKEQLLKFDQDLTHLKEDIIDSYRAKIK